MVIVSLLAPLLGIASALRDIGAVKGLDLSQTEEQIRGCPDGLASQDGLCVYRGMNFTSGGTLNVEALFTEEVAKALQDKTLMKPILAGVSHLWDEHDETLKELVAKFVHIYKSIKAALLPATYYTDGKLDSFIYEAVATVLHVAAKAMESSAGAEVLEYLAMGTQTYNEALGAPFFTTMNILLLYVKYTTSTIKAYEESATIANAMVMKSMCLQQRFHYEESELLNPSTKQAVASAFKPEVQKLCGETALNELAEETYKAHTMMMRMLDQLADIGKCLYPLEDDVRDTRTSADVKCIETIVPVLREAHGQMGILHGSLELAQAFAMATDTVTSKLHYGNTIPSLFNLDIPKLPPVFPALESLSDGKKPVQALSCVALVASQRAYAASFEKLALAIPTWMKSFSRDLLEPSLGTNWYPCQKVVHSLENPKDPMCKKAYAKYPMQLPSNPCSVAYSTHIWE